MLLTETVETLNKRLVDHFGLDTSTSQPIWRIVYSEDQYEHRHGTFNDYSEDGKLFIRTVTETRYVPKYKQWIQFKFVLEQLVIVPTVNLFDLPDTKMSYEPLWVFEDKNGNALPPKWEACKYVIDLVNTARGASDLAKYARYKDPEGSNEEAIEQQMSKVKKIEDELFGEESGLLGSTIDCGTSIIVPQTYQRNNNGDKR